MNKKELILKSLYFCFENSNIKILKYFKKPILQQNCIHIELKNGEISILDYHSDVHKIRLEAFLNILKSSIENLNINCRFILNTSDHESSCRFSVLQFFKSIGSNHLVVPDPHLVIGYKNYKPIDTIAFKDKKNSIIFRGSDTGSYPNANKNERIQICNLLKKENWCDLKISKFTNYCFDSLNFFNIDINEIYGNELNFEEQSKYKYIADIYGHTVAWDRNLWAMGLNSILLKIHYSNKNKIHLWYSKYMDDHNIVPNLKYKNLNNFIFKESEESKFCILQKQLQFSNILNDYQTHIDYLREFIIIYNNIYNE